MRFNLQLFRRYTSSKNYIPELDGLRFLAIISVLLYHTNNRLDVLLPGYHNYLTNFFKTGFLGVDIFFAISGYILSAQIIELYSQKSFSYKSYLKKRLRRIEPPFLISTILIFCLWYFFGSTPKPELLRSLLSVITYTSNITDNNVINVVTWSLEIEIQFYLLLPLFLMIFFKSTKLLYSLLAVLIITGLIFFNFKIIPFKLLPAYVQYFSIGVIIAVLSFKKKQINTFFPGANLLLVFVIFGLGLYYSNVASQLAILLLIGVLFNNVLILKKGIVFFKNGLISVTGGMCYSIYLWHYPVMALFFRNIFTHLQNLHLGDAVLYWLTLIFLSVFQIVLSYSLFILFEKPFMKPWKNPVTA